MSNNLQYFEVPIRWNSLTDSQKQRIGRTMAGLCHFSKVLCIAPCYSARAIVAEATHFAAKIMEKCWPEGTNCTALCFCSTCDGCAALTEKNKEKRWSNLNPEPNNSVLIFFTLVILFFLLYSLLFTVPFYSIDPSKFTTHLHTRPAVNIIIRLIRCIFMPRTIDKLVFWILLYLTSEVIVYGSIWIIFLKDLLKEENMNKKLKWASP